MSASEQLIEVIKQLGNLNVNSETTEKQRTKLQDYIQKKIILMKQNIQLDLSVKLEVNEQDTLDGKDKAGKTALMWATTYGLTQVAQLLMAEGANPKVTDKQGKNTLHFAALYGQLEIIKILNTTMTTLERKDSPEQGITNLQSLLECTDTTMGCTPLLLAAIKGHPDVVSYLIDQKANPDASASIENGNKIELPILPLMAARGIVKQCYPSDCKYDATVQLQILQILKKTGINFNRPTRIEKDERVRHEGGGYYFLKPIMKDFSSLSIAASEGAVVIAQAMLEEGADQNAKSSEGFECLSYALIEKSPFHHGDPRRYEPPVTGIEKIAMLELLLKYKPSQDSLDNGLQSLNIGYQFIDGKLLLLLLEHGANIKKNRYGNDHLHLKNIADKTTFCQILTMQRSGQDIITQKMVNEQLTTFAHYTFVDHVKAIFETKRVDGKTKDSEGKLMVDLALYEALTFRDQFSFGNLDKQLKNHAEIINFLIDQGADANAIVNGKTLLGRAVEYDLAEENDSVKRTMPRLSQLLENPSVRSNAITKTNIEKLIQEYNNDNNLSRICEKFNLRNPRVTWYFANSLAVTNSGMVLESKSAAQADFTAPMQWEAKR